MDIESISYYLNLEYYKSLQNSNKKGYVNIEWLNEYIENLSKNENKIENKNISENENKNISETENYTSIVFNNDNIYKKQWIKLNNIHKILKIKEYVNNLPMAFENDRYKLKEELTNMIKNKKLTKKEAVVYDSVNGKIISLTNLQYNNGKYFIL
jgi:hypothetical protein